MDEAMERQGDEDAALGPARLLDELLGPDARRLIARHIERLLAADIDPTPWPSVYREIRRLEGASRDEAARACPRWPSDVSVGRG